jgi:hypothetical protein
MPGFVDRAIINGKVQEIVWMPSHPLRIRLPSDAVDKGRGGQISSGLSLRTGGPHSHAKSSVFSEEKPPSLVESYKTTHRHKLT